MALTPETLARHELNGLTVRITAADNADLVGIDGRVVGETTRTLRIEAGNNPRGTCGPVKRVPKRGATFEFALGSERVEPTDIAPADPESSDAVRVAVAGERLEAPPARRTERRGEDTWR